jgi:hypothetical protein
MATIKATIKDNKLFIELPINEAVPVSKSGNSRVLAGTAGFDTSHGLEFRGHPVRIGLNVIVPLECPTSDKKEKTTEKKVEKKK